MAREPVVGVTFLSLLAPSFEDFCGGRDMGSRGVVGENVVSGEVGAVVAVVATSEKAGASSWATS